MFSISMRFFSCSITNANNVVYLFEFFTRLPLMMGAKSHGKPHQCSNESESKICSRTIPTQMHSIFMDDDIKNERKRRMCDIERSNFFPLRFQASESSEEAFHFLSKKMINGH